MKKVTLQKMFLNLVLFSFVFANQSVVQSPVEINIIENYH